jgi:hypothetical protein
MDYSVSMTVKRIMPQREIFANLLIKIHRNQQVTGLLFRVAMSLVKVEIQFQRRSRMLVDHALRVTLPG